LSLREEQRLEVFENSILRRILRSKRNEIMGGWRKLHVEELHDLYTSPDVIRMIKSRNIRWANYAAGMGDEECV
jgi:hypothetical protein